MSGLGSTCIVIIIVTHNLFKIKSLPNLIKKKNARFDFFYSFLYIYTKYRNLRLKKSKSYLKLTS